MAIHHPKTGIRQRLSRAIDAARGRAVVYDLSPWERLLPAIEAHHVETGLENCTNEELQSRAAALRSRSGSFDLDVRFLIEGAALVREACSRALRLRHYDVQLVAGLAMAQGNLVEMQTGEGKTLVAVIPAVLRALQGKGAHVLTFNDYLATRDAVWMGPAYELLGLTVGIVCQGMSADERRAAYKADVTYATAREVGYDLLRQSLIVDLSQAVLRPFHFAVVDEADSVLIDEARVPLVIAGGQDEDFEGHDRTDLARLTNGLLPSKHFHIDDGARTVSFTEEGFDYIERALGCGPLQNEAGRPLMTGLNQALHAKALLRRNVDYIVRDGVIEIVDEFTGRVAQGRRWPHGLHCAVEAKEGVPAQPQGCVLNSIAIPHLIRLYPHLCGMTGTALPADDELALLYGLTTVVIPPNLPCIRLDLDDVLFTHKQAKHGAVVAEVISAHRASRPVLIGTASVEESELYALLLRKAGVDCQVLNAANDAVEAAIIAEAGASGAVTVATNMAGRGTDIKLGGSDGVGRDAVIDAGGLYVIGTSRFESRRIDNQLRGRSGRQGDPGMSRFFLSLEDDLMVRYSLAEWIPAAVRELRRDSPIDDPTVTEKLSVVQRKIEGESCKIRRTLWEYASLVESQRCAWQEEREHVLAGQRRGLLEEHCNDKWNDCRASIAESVLFEVEHRLTLYFMDRAWSDHLLAIEDIREGIHLSSLGGKVPLLEFRKAAFEAFDDMRQSVDEQIVAAFERAEITPSGINDSKEGLLRPTSTWTYLVDDSPFEWLGAISSMANIGLGIAAGLWWPLFVVKALWDKRRKR